VWTVHGRLQVAGRNSGGLGVSQLVKHFAGGSVPGRLRGLPWIDQCAALERSCYRGSLIVGCFADLYSHKAICRFWRDGRRRWPEKEQRVIGADLDPGADVGL